jgi:hypothetical protein
MAANRRLAPSDRDLVRDRPYEGEDQSQSPRGYSKPIWLQS